MKKTFTAINIQYPYSQLLLDGKKTIETRTYPIPPKYIGVPLLIIETPGNIGKFKSRIVGIITFRSCFKFASEKAFREQFERHRVTGDSPWFWNDKKGKWGWEISKLQKLPKPLPAPRKRGIKFTLGLTLPSSN